MLDLSLPTALILAVVEGLTEFLPISSTGHMILVGRVLGLAGERASTFEIFIQLGAILAVVVVYWSRFAELVDVRCSQRGFKGKQGLARLVVASLPAFVLGYLLHRTIKAHLFNPWGVALALFSGGIVMILVERRCTQPNTLALDAITMRQAFLIGCFQCFSLWPGMSRSAATIVGGMLLGLERRVAAEFSFLVAVPVMFAATGYDLLKSRAFLSASDIPVFVVGFLVAFVVAVAAIKFFLALLQRWTLTPFAIYRIILGAALLVLLT